jgi:hypothetical protein
MKTTILCLSLLTFAVGCNLDAQNRQSTKTESAGDRQADNPSASPVRPVRAEEVIEPREGKGAKVDAESYRASEGPQRLFGIEPGDGTTKPTAIIADARDWSTRSYAEGDLVGRGLRVTKIDERSVTLMGATGDAPVVLTLGRNVDVRVVRHRLDVVARPLGKNRFALDTNAARAAQRVTPTFETHDLYGGPVLKLGPVAEGSLFYEADLREGDLIAAFDGAPANEKTLEAITSALTDESRALLQLRVIRGGIASERVYATVK